MSAALELLQQLVACPSITPEKAGCQSLLIERLQSIGFTIERLPFAEVNNFWARRGQKKPLLVFLGHTDVVPTGPLAQWASPPFAPTVRDGYLYGRGSADMKASLAAMLVACERFITQNPNPPGSIAWLITGDEEGPSVNGTAKVVQVLTSRAEAINYCLVGEPTCEQQLGDTLKIGRRGSLSAKLTVLGQQGHIAYPQLADNPIHKALPALNQLIGQQWDLGTEFFQPTCLQVSNIQAGTGAANVIPHTMELQFNLRYAPLHEAKQLRQAIVQLLDQHELDYQIEWRPPSLPYLTTTGRLVETCITAIQTHTQLKPTLSTTGGTSDGRFIAPLGAEVVEFGPCNRTIHQLNECVAVADLEKLALIYQQILTDLLLTPNGPP